MKTTSLATFKALFQLENSLKNVNERVDQGDFVPFSCFNPYLLKENHKEKSKILLFYSILRSINNKLRGLLILNLSFLYFNKSNFLEYIQ